MPIDVGHESTQKSAPSSIRLGTRRSPLARWQTQRVVDTLQKTFSGTNFEIVELDTTGDASSQPVSELGAVGVFTVELEAALVSQEIDSAVHSLKDLPTTQRAGLLVGAVCHRDDVRDVLVSGGAELADLEPGSRIGTSSPRRAAQIRGLRPDLLPKPIRGNIETRLNKVGRGEYDAVVMAAAGIHRLGLESQITQYFSVDEILPAPGQGALAVQCRGDDEPVADMLRAIDEADVRAAVEAERIFLAQMEGGCTAPVGALATVHGDKLLLKALVVSVDGSQKILVTEQGSVTDPGQLAHRAARAAFERGARELIA